jgi:hypothetical protein
MVYPKCTGCDEEIRCTTASHVGSARESFLAAARHAAKTGHTVKVKTAGDSYQKKTIVISSEDEQ